MKSTIEIDDAVLDELVCGGLPRGRYRQIVSALEAQPDKWQACALAFLHEQAIAEEIAALAKADIDWEMREGEPAENSLSSGAIHATTPACDSNRVRPFEARLGHQAPTKVNGTGVVDSADELPAKVVRNYSSTAAKRLLFLQRGTSIAAMLLISFTLGWLGSGFSGKHAKPASGQVAADPAGDKSTVTNRFEGAAEPSELRSQSVHLTGKQFLPIDREVPAMLRELERRGHARIESIDGFMPMELEDGSSVLVPVQEFTVVPVVYKY